MDLTQFSQVSEEERDLAPVCTAGSQEPDTSSRSAVTFSKWDEATAIVDEMEAKVRPLGHRRPAVMTAPR